MIKYKPSSFSIIMTFLGMVIAGLGAIPLLDIQFVPSSVPRGFYINYSWPNTSARIIEEEVTSRLEALFSRVKGISSITSLSSNGSGQVNLRLKKDVNYDAARFEIASIIRRTYPQLPPQLSYPSLSAGMSAESTEPILTYTLTGNSNSYYLQKYAEQYLVPKLSNIKGINQVVVNGGTLYEWEIEFNSNSLEKLNIKPADIETAINSAFASKFIGSAVTPLSDNNIQKINLLLRGRSADSIRLEMIPVKAVENRIIYVANIAKIKYKEQSPNKYFRINGRNTLTLTVYPEKNINTLRLSKKVKEEVDILQRSIGHGYSLQLLRDSSQFINDELNKIAVRTISSLSIVLIFIFIASRQAKYALIILISLATNMAIACIFYYLFRVSIHFYSLAGITISFGLILDNIIIMMDHIRKRRNQKIFITIVAATLTTICALSVIFLFDEQQKNNLTDLVWIIIINLAVSSSINLFLLPALLEKLPVKNRTVSRLRKRFWSKVRAQHHRSIVFSKRNKWVYITVFVFAFGLPIHLLPTSLDEKQEFWPTAYNTTLGNQWFTTQIRPMLEKLTGGSFRLFTENIFESSFNNEPAETQLTISGELRESSSIAQLNAVMIKLENFLSQFDQIALFKTSIPGNTNAILTILFTPDNISNGFPAFLKSRIESKVIELGGIDWKVYGVGQGFSNAIHTSHAPQRIILEGYNYEQLYHHAEQLKVRLLENLRIKDVLISAFDNRNMKTEEYFVQFNPDLLALDELTLQRYLSALRDRSYKAPMQPISIDGEAYPVNLVSDTYGKYDTWDFFAMPIAFMTGDRKLSALASIVTQKTGNTIYKADQQYRLTVSYDFIGDATLSIAVKDDHIRLMNSLLPLGFKASLPIPNTWDRDDANQYYLLFLIIVIIYFICSILLESLLQPLAIIIMIPISYIGAFLSFYLLDVNFDQGALASLILLSALTINSGLYIVNDFDNSGRQNIQAYLRAFYGKIAPISLTVASSVLGLVPFLWNGRGEAFWFTFATGLIGGLIFSLIAITFYLSLFLRLRSIKKNSNLPCHA